MTDVPAPAVRSTKRAVVVARAIVDQIVDQALAPGAELASEADMVAEFGVGRGSLREALRLLEGQGVVSIRTGPGGGPRVEAVTATPMATNLALYLQRAGGTFRDVMEVRRALEPQIAMVAASNQRALAPDLLTASERGAVESRTDGFVAAAADFHDLVATSTGNPLFAAILQSLHRITEPLAARLEYSVERRHELVEAHHSIAAAIRSGEPEAARSAMERDLDQFVAHAERTDPDLIGRPITWAMLP